jgi:hypothetical protein
MSTLTASESLLERIRSEFLESPGLRLTAWQFQRLWHLVAQECRFVIDRLLRTQFLREARDGTLVRRESDVFPPRSPAARASRAGGR